MNYGEMWYQNKIKRKYIWQYVVKSIFCFHQSYIDYMTLFDLHYLTGKEQVKTKKLSNSKWSQNLFSNNLLIVML